MTKRHLKKTSRYIAKFLITLDLKFKFALLILLIYEVKVFILIIIKIPLLYKLLYCFIVYIKGIKIIDEARNIRKKIGEISNKQKLTSTSLNNIVGKIYSVIISKIYILLYGITLNTKFTDVFNLVNKVKFAKIILLRLIVCYFLR